MFDTTGSKPKAIGVKYLEGICIYGATPFNWKGKDSGPTGSGSVTATGEIIVSAGAFNTPQLLKLSGIGPTDELTSMSIPVLVDLPGVGQNLQDRYENTVVASTTSGFNILDGCTLVSTGDAGDACLQTWEHPAGPQESQKGVYTGNAFPLATIFRSTVATLPDVFLFGGPVSFHGFYPGWATVKSLFPSTAKGWRTWVSLKAQSHNLAGTVTLRSINPLDTPIVNFNSWATGTRTDGAFRTDLTASVEGVTLARKAMDMVNDIYQRYGGGEVVFTETYPGPEIDSEEKLKEWIQFESFGHHASCTASIGADGDRLAVLDTNFTVRGVNGLRVVDARYVSFSLSPLLSSKECRGIVKEEGARRKGGS